MLLSILPGSGVTLVTTLLQLPAQLNTLELHLPGEIFNFSSVDGINNTDCAEDFRQREK